MFGTWSRGSDLRYDEDRSVVRRGRPRRCLRDGCWDGRRPPPVPPRRASRRGGAAPERTSGCRPRITRNSSASVEAAASRSAATVPSWRSSWTTRTCIPSCSSSSHRDCTWSPRWPATTIAAPISRSAPEAAGATPSSEAAANLLSELGSAGVRGPGAPAAGQHDGDGGHPAVHSRARSSAARRTACRERGLDREALTLHQRGVERVPRDIADPAERASPRSAPRASTRGLRRPPRRFP